MSSERIRSRRRHLLKIQANRCFYCACQLNHYTATADHLTPKVLGGGDDLDNLAVTCYECNQERGTMSIVQFFAMKRKKFEISCLVAALAADNIRSEHIEMMRSTLQNL